MLEGEEQTGHEAAGTGIRAPVIARCKCAAGIIDIISLIASKGVEVLGRDIDTYTADITLKDLVGDIIAQLYVGNLPLSGILDLTITEQIVPCHTVRRIIGTGYI